IHGGVDFWNRNKQVLSEAEARYGIPAQVIVAIIGVETLYGGNTGSYRVIDALSTLAFDYPARAPFFRSELKEFLILSREQEQSPLVLKGSYAGAMGLGQFMPSSYRAYAADSDNDGFIDIWNNEADAIWSVANYLSRHGWSTGQTIAHPAIVSGRPEETVLNQSLVPEHSLQRLREAGLQPAGTSLSPELMATAMLLEGDDGDEYWIGMHNFYVITRYNHSSLYAMAVFQLAEEIREHKR
ncbi:MAG: lytic murein transglycosylase B, partial [Pseudomonadales bacterium]